MSNSSELNSYIGRLQHRLRLGAWWRGATIFTATALTVTLVLVLILNHLAFPTPGIAVARLAIFIALTTAAIFGVALPLIRMTPARAVREAEAANPELQQRMTTFKERATKDDDPFLELLAADTLEFAQDTPPSSLVPDKRLFALGGASFACLSVLVWIIAAGPGFLGYGASLVWIGAKKNTPPLYSIAVRPGNITVRRNSDQLIVARVTGMSPEKAQLFARYRSAAVWEPVTMQAAPDSSGGANYQFVLAGLPEDVEYYVAAGPLVSPHYEVRVVDLPSVKGLRVTYHYPKWTGLKPVTQEHTGDLRAIEGTDAEIQLRMDRPIKDGQLTLDDGHTIPLAAGPGNTYRGTIPMEKDGAYHLAATDQGQPIRISEDYFIATDKALPPEISIARPGGDYRASPIEEVTVGVKGADQFGLDSMHLHYSVNGGADHDVNLLKTPGAKQADGSYMLSLEDFKLVPGDLVSIYATAKDGHSQAQTDISFIQVDPFERDFSQSQQSGGGSGGGGGGNQTEISKREKELIAATWKQQNDKAATAKDAVAQGQFLSDAQQKLRDQVNALSVRMQSRDISEANQEFTDFDKDMQAAAAAMAPSAEKLKGMQWKDALPLEQKALQSLLRAEATFRQIEVAFGQRGGGGGGGGNSGRDLASLFDLELDTAKNQYETAQTATPQEQHEKDVENALQKLDALARRQQDLANQPQNGQQSFQQRWQQEMLQREAEQLQRQMEQLSRNGKQQGSGDSSNSPQVQNGGQSASNQGSAQQGAASGGTESQGSPQAARGRTGGQSSAQASSQSSDSRIEQALSRLQQATAAMQGEGSPQQRADAARQAAERLRQADNLLAGTQQQLAAGNLGSMTSEAERLAQEEREQADRINKLANAGQQKNINPTDLDSMMARLRTRDQLAQQRQQLSNDLSNLQQNLRDAARNMAPDQPGVAEKLRDALSQMDESDLDNHVQRTADWLRSGINPNSNGTEGEIAQGLQNLSRQLQQAQSAMGQTKPGQSGAGQGDVSAALGQVERLRSQMERMTRAQSGSQGREGQNGQDENGQNGQGPGRQSAGANGEGRPQQQASIGRNGQQSAGNGQNGQPGGAFGQQSLSRSGQSAGARGDARNGLGGDTRIGGGANGTVWGNFDTGNNTPVARGQQPAAPGDASGNPADTERLVEQGMRELNQLRQSVKDDPQAAQDVAELQRQMQRLDASRFRGNPAMVEQMHRQLLGSVDKLELQLQHDGAGTDARTGKPNTVPAGYQESVAEYYRRLSKIP